MKIQLNENYRIVTDKLNYTLFKKATNPKVSKYKLSKKNINPGYDIIGYYSELKHLANDLVENNILTSEAKSFKEVLILLKKVKESITLQCEKVVGLKL